MLRRVLILLGETPSSEYARHYALRLARETGAEVAGLAGIDLRYIEAPMPGTIGSSAYKVWLEQDLRKEAEDARRRVHETFERECKERNVIFEWLSFEGDPNEHLLLAAETCDIIVTGHDTAYHGDIREQLPEMLSKLLLATPRPVIVCPDQPSSGTDVLIAYDSSLPAMRAVQLFCLLGIARNSRIYVSSIGTTHQLATRTARNVSDYLRIHRHQVEACPVSSDADPSEILRFEVTERNIGTLVMGAYGRRGLREYLFGSTTNSVVAAPPCTIFLYH